MIWKPRKEKRNWKNLVLIPLLGYLNNRIIAQFSDKEIRKWCKKLALVSVTEYDCNCHDKNGQKKKKTKGEKYSSNWFSEKRKANWTEKDYNGH